jgi:FMN phosphatase YigB (HAD superfamily)
MAIKAVLLDLGETLWHFPQMPPIEVIRGETVHRISDLLRSWGVTPAGELFFLGRDIRFAIEKATDEAYWDDLASPDYPQIAKRVAAQKGLSIDDEQAVKLWHTWNLGGVFLGRELHLGVVETLRWFREHGYRVGAVTNRGLGDEPFREELRYHGLLDLFEVMSISCEVGYLKPHPRIFQHALDALGIEPGEAVMVGDSLRADVGGAKALGMTAVLKRNKVAEKDPEKDMGRSERNSRGDSARPDFVVDEIGDLVTLPIFAPK